MKRSARFPTSEAAKRLAAIMHRKVTTPWCEKKEIPPFRKLVVDLDELAMVERYYRMNWPPRSNVNHLRHDLATLLNNWNGEVDRARAWDGAHPVKPAPRKIIPLPKPAEQELTAAERITWEAEFEKLMGRKPRNL